MSIFNSSLPYIITGVALNCAAIYGKIFFNREVDVYYFFDRGICCFDSVTNEQVPFFNEVIIPPIKNSFVSAAFVTSGALLMYSGFNLIYGEILDVFENMQVDFYD